MEASARSFMETSRLSFIESSLMFPLAAEHHITSEFWKEVCSYAVIKRRLSTVYHPQTDGQSEALNRIVADYLRAYCADEPTAWVNCFLLLDMLTTTL
jgi:hypothetical protein